MPGLAVDLAQVFSLSSSSASEQLLLRSSATLFSRNRPVPPERGPERAPTGSDLLFIRFLDNDPSAA